MKKKLDVVQAKRKGNERNGDWGVLSLLQNK
jgi:hypothetical protein